MDVPRFTSTALILAACLENSRQSLLDSTGNALFVSSTTGLSQTLSFYCVVFVNAFQVLAAIVIVMPLPTARLQIAKSAGFAVMAIVLTLELVLRLVSKDSSSSYRCMFLIAACGLRLVDSLSSQDRRIYSGFVGQVNDEFHAADVVVGRLREGATRYKATSLTKVFTAGVLIHVILYNEVMFFPRSALRRQLARSSWMFLISMLALAYSVAVFDRTHVSNRRKSY
jgi:hypothetical protein